MTPPDSIILDIPSMDLTTPIPATNPAPDASTWNVNSALSAASEACGRIAPLWPLRHFVAVNPFLGFTGKPFPETCETVARVARGGMQMSLGYYREKLAAGEIETGDLEIALERAATLGKEFPESWGGHDADSLRTAILEEGTVPEDIDPLPTFSEAFDRLHGSRWSIALQKATTDFCAAWLDEGQSAWRIPWNDGSRSLFSAWREYAAVDRQLECLGLEGFRDAIASLPESPAEVLAVSLERLGIELDVAPAWLHRVLLTIRGWAGYLQYQSREKKLRGSSDDEGLIELLAVRVAGEAILFDLLGGGEIPGLDEYWPPVFPADGEREGSSDVQALSRPVAIGWLAQLAHEHAWERRMKAALAGAATSGKKGSADSDRADVQAVFCIDVRSEVFRRALESVSPGIRTSGFAGFFGLPIEYRPLSGKQGRAQCPVLLVPRFEVPECHHDVECDAHARKRLGRNRRLNESWNAFKTSAISCFSFVETAGLLFGGSLVRDGFGGKKASGPGAGPGFAPSLAGIGADERVALAHGMLGNLGLTDGFGRLVLLCGHGSQTVNNPYGSGLDCGACGGHAGDANARVGAALLNDPEVRRRLSDEHGITVPGDTWFLAGLHNTTTDDVTLFDLDKVPDILGEEVQALQGNLAAAAKRSRKERAALLGLAPDDDGIEEDIRSRSKDWSQVRPEWGLAGNAAFVAAPRSRTRGANLGGRVFLHDYDHHGDPDNAILEMIMSAPMVVASWINLQYFGSTVNNEVFGSGNKVLHNVVGTLGVCLGNQGDLQTGLPLQSVHDGNRFIHEPIRLHVFLEAPKDGIDAVIANNAAVRELVDHQWVHVFSLAEDGTASRRRPGGGWE